MPAVRETPAVSSSANSAKAVSGSSSASRTLRESDARATPHAESEETENRGTCPFRSFAMRLQPQSLKPRAPFFQRRLALRIRDPRMIRAQALAARSGQFGWTCQTASLEGTLSLPTAKSAQHPKKNGGASSSALFHTHMNQATQSG